MLIETIFDTLNAKAALVAVDELSQSHDVHIPIILAVTITDLSGRNLSGQTVEASGIRCAMPGLWRQA
nr:homocysteine S-methyltransferase family protein [Iodidimonas nitroreducens]